MHSNNNQGLIIGLCGRLGSGKEEVAQIISKYQGTECQVISITETMNIREFLDDTLKMMQEKQMGLDLSCYNTNQLEELEKLLKETRDQHFHPHSTKQKLESCLTYNPRHQILYPITDKYELELLYQRNYFHLIAVEAPIIKRYENFMKKYQLNIPLDLFCIIDDVISDNISEFMHKAKVQIGNVGDQKDLLISFYKKYQDIFRPIRPNWNQYFMHLANVVKQRSNCMKRAVGVVIVKDSRIVATGYNGTPYGKQNCWEKGCDRCNQNTKQGVDLEKCFCFHAEESAILEIGTKKSKNMVMYTTLFPCLQCTKIILSTKLIRYIMKKITIKVQPKVNFINMLKSNKLILVIMYIDYDTHQQSLNNYKLKISDTLTNYFFHSSKQTKSNTNIFFSHSIDLSPKTQSNIIRH